MTSEEFWTVPFKEEVTNNDGHQFAGLIVSIRSGRNTKDKAIRRAKNYFRRDRGLYNGPTLPEHIDVLDVIAKSEVHRSTAGEIFHSNISMGIEHETSAGRGSYDSYSRYHFPEPENGPSRLGKVENRFESLDIDGMV